MLAKEFDTKDEAVTARRFFLHVVFRNTKDRYFDIQEKNGKFVLVPIIIKNNVKEIDETVENGTRPINVSRIGLAGKMLIDNLPISRDQYITLLKNSLRTADKIIYNPDGSQYMGELSSYFEYVFEDEQIIDLQKQKLENSQKFLDEIKKKLKGKNFKPAGSLYQDESGNFLSRVTSMKKAPNKIFGTEAANRGTLIDDMLRSFLLSPEISKEDFLANFEKAHKKMKNTLPVPEFSKDFVYDLYSSFTKFKNHNPNLTYTVDIPALFGKIQGIDFAGTIDILAIDNKTGDIYIIDLKSSTRSRAQAYKDPESFYAIGDTLQLNAYAELLKQMTGQEVKGLYTFPLVSTVDKSGTYTNVTVEDGIVLPVKKTDINSLIKLEKEEALNKYNYKFKGDVLINGIKIPLVKSYAIYSTIDNVIKDYLLDIVKLNNGARITLTESPIIYLKNRGIEFSELEDKKAIIEYVRSFTNYGRAEDNQLAKTSEADVNPDFESIHREPNPDFKESDIEEEVIVPTQDMSKMTVAELRAAEKVEMDATSTTDTQKRKDIYEKYNKLITPRIRFEKAEIERKRKETKESITSEIIDGTTTPTFFANNDENSFIAETEEKIKQKIDDYYNAELEALKVKPTESKQPVLPKGSLKVNGKSVSLEGVPGEIDFTGNSKDTNFSTMMPELTPLLTTWDADFVNNNLVNYNGQFVFNYNNRVTVLIKVGKFIIPYYFSSQGTSGKAIDWHYIFGVDAETGWIIKGGVDEKGEVIYNKQLSELYPKAIAELERIKKEVRDKLSMSTGQRDMIAQKLDRYNLGKDKYKKNLDTIYKELDVVENIGPGGVDVNDNYTYLLNASLQLIQLDKKEDTPIISDQERVRLLREELASGTGRMITEMTVEEQQLIDRTPIIVPSSVEDIVQVFHHTSVSVKDFNFSNFQRGKEQISQFGDGLALSTDTTPFLQNRYGNPIVGEVRNSDFIEVDTNKTEKELYEYFVSLGYKFNSPQTGKSTKSGGKYIKNSPSEQYDGTARANLDPSVILLFNDLQESNPQIKGVKIINHIIGGQNVSPFYVVYDSKSFYGEGSLKKSSPTEEVEPTIVPNPVEEANKKRRKVTKPGAKSGLGKKSFIIDNSNVIFDEKTGKITVNGSERSITRQVMAELFKNYENAKEGVQILKSIIRTTEGDIEVFNKKYPDNDKGTPTTNSYIFSPKGDLLGSLVDLEEDGGVIIQDKKLFKDNGDTASDILNALNLNC